MSTVVERYEIEGHYLSRNGERIWRTWIKVGTLAEASQTRRNAEDLICNDINGFNKLRIVKIIEQREVIE